VFSHTSPTMISAYSFKKPTDLEFDHDFLWRINQQSPKKGCTKIFVRSHYEDILIQRVHGWIDEKRVDLRMESINAYEKLLQKDNNTLIMKFFLHLSKDRQKEKLIERIEIPRKNYKHNDGDWEERQHWDKYMAAYEDAINRSDIPWYIVPSNQRWYRNYFVATEILKTLKQLNLSYPPLSEKPQIDMING
jgi:polyphosphate kinase 2 (PPK2 family)